MSIQENAFEMSFQNWPPVCSDLKSLPTLTGRQVNENRGRMLLAKNPVAGYMHSLASHICFGDTFRALFSVCSKTVMQRFV